MAESFLGSFSKLRKVTYLRHVCPSVRMEQQGSHLTDFHEIWLSIVRKYVEKLKASLTSDKINGYFTWRPVCVYDISLNFSWNEKWSRQKVVEEIKTHFMFSNFFPDNRAVYEIMWKNVVEPDRPQVTM
jgi:hypothetical protein